MTRPSRLFPVAIAALACAIALRAPWNGTASARFAADDDHAIAVCATLSITDELMESDRFRPAREELTRLKQESIQPLADEMADIQSRGQAAAAAGEDLSGLQQEYQNLQQRLQQANQQAQLEVSDLMREQVKECYDLVRTSASAVAEDLGYDYVVSSSRTDDEIGENPAGEFLARPMLVYPEDADITEEVRDDLKLE